MDVKLMMLVVLAGFACHSMALPSKESRTTEDLLFRELVELILEKEKGLEKQKALETKRLEERDWFTDECTLCRLIMKTLDETLSPSATEEEAFEAVQGVCDLLGTKEEYTQKGDIAEDCDGIAFQTLGEDWVTGAWLEKFDICGAVYCG